MLIIRRGDGFYYSRTEYNTGKPVIKFSKEVNKAYIFADVPEYKQPILRARDTIDVILKQHPEYKLQVFLLTPSIVYET